ncbi:PIG-L family deacetylase [Streptomyces pactum]|uniref:PIG-L family deacetylase n=1 Tax=Streptomyces pactum TaxID=68249 RepID=UPI0036F5523C
MAEPGLLCVHAHPDDEALWTGGVLAKYAGAGARTGVVTCTWAEGTRRAGELERSLDILGAGAPRLLGYADNGVPDSAPGAPPFSEAPFDEVTERLVGQIRRFRPDVVITYDAYGGYGHPDHVRAHRATVAAVEAAGHDQLYPESGAPWQPRALYLVTVARSVVAEVWREAFGERAEDGGPLPGVPDERITTVVDVRPWADRKWAALHAHVSEVERGAAFTRLTSLPAPLRDRLLGTEWYLRRDLVPAAGPGRDLPGEGLL